MAEKMIKEGREEGAPTVRFDKDKRQNYHLNAKGERVWHERPPGVTFDEEGRIKRQPEGQVVTPAPDVPAPVEEKANG